MRSGNLCRALLPVLVPLLVLLLNSSSVARALDDCLIEYARSPRGEISSVAADGSLLVYGSGTGFIVEDITDPGYPMPLAEFGLDSDITDVAIEGHIGYATSAVGLHIIDLSEPDAPREVGILRLSYSPGAVEVAGGWVWVAGGKRVSVVDVRNPSRPLKTWQASCPATCDVRDLSVEGSNLHVIGSEYWILDANTPRFESPVGRLQVSGWEIEAIGGKALVRVGREVNLVDITDLQSPVILGSVETTSRPRDIAVFPSGIVVVCTKGLSILDVDSPGSPIETEYYRFFVDHEESELDFIAGTGNDGFIASNSTIQAVDFSDPLDLGYLGYSGNPSTRRVAVSGAVVVAIYGDPPGWGYGSRRKQLSIHGLAEDQLTEIGYWETEGQWEYPYDVEMVGSTAFVATSATIASIDLSDPQNPVVLDQTWTGANELAIDGDRAYYAENLCERACGFGSFDISDPSDLSYGSSVTLEDAWPVCSGPTDIDARDDTVIIGTSDGFRLVDVADPLAPFQIVHMVLDDGWFRRAVLLLDDLALVSTSTGVSVFDIQDREHPTAIGSWGGAIHLAEFRDGVLVASPGGSVNFLDLNDPTHPILTDRFSPSHGSIFGAGTQWPHFVAAHGPNGLIVGGVDRSCLSPRRSSPRRTP